MYEEPPVRPDDTRPTMTVPIIDSEDHPAPASGSRLFGALSLLGAIFFAAATIILLLTNNTPATPPEPLVNDDDAIVEVLPTASPTLAEPTNEAQPQVTTAPEILFVPAEAIPTADSSLLVSLLGQAPQQAVEANPYTISRDLLSPFTVIPDRPRNQIIEYTIQRGDTVSDLAQRFGIEQDSIAWANDQQALWMLVPGSVLLIPPVDGVVHIATGDDTVRGIATFYGLTDPLIVIDSEYNQLKGYTPDMQLPSGLRVFIPGGKGVYVNWAPQLTTGGNGTGSGASADSNLVQFPAGPGTCGLQERGPSSGWVRPLASYNITRGFADWHMGIDLGASEGTPIMAANTGRVIFAGWSTWGYGYMVALSHGPYTTLYAHMSAYNVSCGQVVSAGQVIGAVGSTGNSSGPHLHFEILYGFTRGNPASTIGF